MTDTNSTTPIKPKRGRKPKALSNPPPEIVLVNEEVSANPPPPEKLTILVLNTTEDVEHETEVDVEADASVDAASDNKPLPKKRGRKPKGGKIVQPVVPIVAVEAAKENVILHLKCSLKDLNIQQNEEIESYNFSSEIVYEPIHQDTSHIYVNHATAYDEISYGGTELEQSHINSEKDVDTKEIWKKLKQLEHSLHLNNINDKKSACFWCTHDFDNPPVYIPKYFLNESYHVYGCFCSPE